MSHAEEEERPLLADVEPLETGPRPFAPDEMVACEKCLRTNPPTRTNCLYCGTVLPVTEKSRELRRPALRPLEQWERGFNCICIPHASHNLNERELNAAAELLRLKAEELNQILETKAALPLARAASVDEAELIESRLGALGLSTFVVSDESLLSTQSRRVRAVDFTDDALVIHPTGGGREFEVSWRDVSLLVAGRLFVRRVELSERRGKREKEITDAREMSADDQALDIYARGECCRISASNFDFSSLGAKKSLLAAENFQRLAQSFCERVGFDCDDSFNRVRRALNLVWPPVQRTESQGWRRGAPGRYSTEAAISSDNEAQFTRYSHLRHYLKRERPELFKA